MAVIGIGSSGIQVTSNIADKVSKLYTWIRAPTWITAGFAQEHAGPNGENIRCESFNHLWRLNELIGGLQTPRSNRRTGQSILINTKLTARTWKMS